MSVNVCKSSPQAPVGFEIKIKRVFTYSNELKKSIPGFISIIDIHSLHQGDNRYPMAKFLTLICKEQGQKLTIFASSGERKSLGM